MVSVVTAIGAVAIALLWPIEAPEPYSLILATLYPVVGGLIAGREPRNAVGWLLIGIGLTEGMSVLAIAWAPVALDVAPGALPAGPFVAWLSDWLWMPGHDLLLTFLPLCFPDGRLPGGAWRLLAAFAAVAVAIRLAAPMTVLTQIPLRRSFYEFYPDERLATALGTIGYGMVRLAAVGCLAALVWRLWQMPRKERGPYTWFAMGAAGTAALVVPLQLITDPVVHEVVRLVAVACLPLGAAVAILRHRAYGIDVVVNRTLVYVALSTVLVATYLATAAVVEIVLEGPGPVSTIGAAATTALVLSPVRDRLQRLFDRLMYGDSDGARDIVSGIGAQLEAITHGTDVLADAAARIADKLRLPYVAVEVEHTDGPRVLVAKGEAGAAVERLPLIANGAVVGHLAVGTRRGQARLSERDRATLRQIAGIAATAVRQIQLTDELRRARGRLAAALEEERRRIRRDLHDGLGPSLATVVMGLEEARAVHRDDAERTETLLFDLKSQTRRAIDDIRSLVYGLRPPALDDLGLVSAVRQLAAGTATRTGVRIEVDAPDELPELPAVVEVAAFRIVQEATTNVVRHAGATAVTVTLDCCREGWLRVRVSDDGKGLPERLEPGVGLTSIRERAEDVGGTVSIDGRNGTVVEAALPLAAP